VNVNLLKRVGKVFSAWGKSLIAMNFRFLSKLLLKLSIKRKQESRLCYASRLNFGFKDCRKKNDALRNSESIQQRLSEMAAFARKSCTL
jgi:hypothetical protein